MAPSPCINLGPTEQAQLLEIARGSIASGLESRRPMAVVPEASSGALAASYGNFVTLMRQGRLRGCMGQFAPQAPLPQGVAITAFNAAFNDPRFAPLGRHELATTAIEISVLSAPEAIAAESFDELVAQLRPGVDGLMVEDQGRRGTLLPKVWEQLGDAGEFVGQVMLKAGLSAGHWSEGLRWSRYEAVCFGESAATATVA